MPMTDEMEKHHNTERRASGRWDDPGGGGTIEPEQVCCRWAQTAGTFNRWGWIVAKPMKTLWAADPHTLAKHRLLVRYLEAWLPIMALSHVGRLVLIDGFAGPGRYVGGEPGSPLLMLDTYLSHRSLPKMAHVEMTFVFIEERADRVANLQAELGALTLPKNVDVAVIEGEFDVEVGRLLDGLPVNHRLAPTFAFIDPFGYTGYDLHLTSRILAFPKCEVLIYLPLPFIARFINDETIAPALTNLFGDRIVEGSTIGWKRQGRITGAARPLSREGRAVRRPVPVLRDSRFRLEWLSPVLWDQASRRHGAHEGGDVEGRPSRWRGLPRLHRPQSDGAVRAGSRPRRPCGAPTRRVCTGRLHHRASTCGCPTDTLCMESALGEGPRSG